MADMGRGPIALDTAVFIYYIEEHRTYLPLVEPLFTAIDAGRQKAVTSALTLLETWVVPLRGGRLSLAQRYEEILTRSRHLTLIELDHALLWDAASLRARFRVKTPDALQLAAALRMKCTSFITNDRKLPSSLGLKILQLRDYL